MARKKKKIGKGWGWLWLERAGFFSEGIEGHQLETRILFVYATFLESALSQLFLLSVLFACGNKKKGKGKGWSGEKARVWRDNEGNNHNNKKKRMMKIIKQTNAKDNWRNERKNKEEKKNANIKARVFFVCLCEKVLHRRRIRINIYTKATGELDYIYQKNGKEAIYAKRN